MNPAVNENTKAKPRHSSMSPKRDKLMTDAERWHAAKSPLELHAHPYQIVIEGVHSGPMSRGEWGRRFCLHLFPDASSLECICGGPLRFLEASSMVLFGRFRKRDFGKKLLAATEWCQLVYRLDDLGLDVPTPTRKPG